MPRRATVCSRASTACDRPDRSRRSVIATGTRFAAPSRRISSVTTSPTTSSIQADLQLAAVLHRLAVERQHDVAGAQPGPRPRAAGHHVGQDDALTRAATQDLPRAPGSPSARGRRCRLGAPARSCDLLVHRADDVARRGEPRPSLPPPATAIERVDAHEPAAQIDQRSAAAARIDRRVGLHVDHRRLGLELPRDGADDAERHRVVRGRAGCRTRARAVRRCSSSESPNGSAGRFRSSTLITARSVSRSIPTIARRRFGCASRESTGRWPAVGSSTRSRCAPVRRGRW